MGSDFFQSPPPDAPQATESLVAGVMPFYSTKDVEWLVRGAGEVLGALTEIEGQGAIDVQSKNAVRASIVTLEAALKPFARTPAQLISMAGTELDLAWANPPLMGGHLDKARRLIAEAGMRLREAERG